MYTKLRQTALDEFDKLRVHAGRLYATETILRKIGEHNAAARLTIFREKCKIEMTHMMTSIILCGQLLAKDPTEELLKWLPVPDAIIDSHVALTSDQRLQQALELARNGHIGDALKAIKFFEKFPPLEEEFAKIDNPGEHRRDDCIRALVHASLRDELLHVPLFRVIDRQAWDAFPNKELGEFIEDCKDTVDVEQFKQGASSRQPLPSPLPAPPAPGVPLRLAKWPALDVPLPSTTEQDDT